MSTIGDVMVRELVTVDEGTPIIEACRIMGVRHIGAILVTRDGRIHGIFTERDLLSRVLAGGVDLDTPVGDLATSPLITVDPATPIRMAARVMADMHVKRLAVVEDGEVVGIFTSSDLADVIGESPLDF